MKNIETMERSLSDLNDKEFEYVAKNILQEWIVLDEIDQKIDEYEYYTTKIDEHEFEEYEYPENIEEYTKFELDQMTLIYNKKDVEEEIQRRFYDQI